MHDGKTSEKPAVTDTVARLAEGDRTTALVPTGQRVDATVPPLFAEPARLPESHTFVDPMNPGNAWMAIQDATGVVRYMSDQWDGRVIGFEKRDMPPVGEVHIAQTHSPAMGMVAFGGGSMMVRRNMANAYRYHHLSIDTAGADAQIGADPVAQAYLKLTDKKRQGLPTVLTSNILFGSGLYRDTFSNSARLKTLRENVRKMTEQARALDKDLWIDRVLLSLFEGKADATPSSALYEYGVAMKRMRTIIAEETGQPRAPVFVISQGAKGSEGAILAEAQLDIDHWSLGAVVATPKYRLPIQPDTHSTLTVAAARYVSEMEAVAADTVLNGAQWYCPRLTHATVSGQTVRAHFMTCNTEKLVLDDKGHHGFSLHGGGAVGIESVVLNGQDVEIRLDAPPPADLRLAYALGPHASSAALRDTWGRPAMHDPAVTLRRYALTSMVEVVRA